MIQSSIFRDWYDNLDHTLRMRVEARLARISAFGNLGDHKNLKDGVFELRFLMHSGMRIYFGIEEQNKIILLLVGGSKSSQVKDIAKAKRFWRKHKGA
ncbi:MAG: type II toxin-antitoxin system RelE/ParE family toxin [Bacteriovoracaceae bacterium]|nr:type II toxin-antitoxin system RelE/ParE family toxin [Bacteriovoracaceae bacterium]